MTIKRVDGFVLVCCEACAAIHDGETREWKAAIDSSRAGGFCARKIGDTWHHFCSEGCMVTWQKRAMPWTRPQGLEESQRDKDERKLRQAAEADAVIASLSKPQ